MTRIALPSAAILLASQLSACSTPPTSEAPITEPTGMNLVATAQPPLPPLAQPVSDAELAREFNNIHSNGAVYFSGWPTEAGLRALAARGVKRIITLKTPDETISARGYDPRKVAKELGITLVEMPVNAETLSDAYIDKLTREIDRDGGPTLLQCGSSSTVGMVWGSYLAKSKGASAADAMAQARAAGLKDGPLADAAQKYINATAAAGAPAGAPAKSGSNAEK
jgi:protein tyrosine phosphatase (PTP) superfamily phosphohydrolase (DUF442 family)